MAGTVCIIPFLFELEGRRCCTWRKKEAGTFGEPDGQQQQELRASARATSSSGRQLEAAGNGSTRGMAERGRQQHEELRAARASCAVRVLRG